MTRENHYLSTDSDTGLYLTIPQLSADRQACGIGVKPNPSVYQAKSPSSHLATPLWDSPGNLEEIECSIVSANAVQLPVKEAVGNCSSLNHHVSDYYCVQSLVVSVCVLVYTCKKVLSLQYMNGMRYCVLEAVVLCCFKCLFHYSPSYQCFLMALLFMFLWLCLPASIYKNLHLLLSL